MSNKKILFFYLILLFVYTADLFQNVPPSRIIEVSDAGEYTFGVDEEWSDPDLQICYYKTDTGLQASFPIMSPLKETQDYSENTKQLQNIVTTLGVNGSCQINVKKVNANGPTKWTLTLGDSLSHNLSSIDFFVKFFYELNVLEHEIKLLQSKSFYNHIMPITGKKFVSCHLKVKDLDVDLKIDSAESLQGDGLSQHISSLGSGFCGLKYDNAVFEDISYIRWYLTAEDTDGNWYKGTFRTSVTSTLGFFHVTKLVVLGSSVTIKCGEQFAQTFCTLFNPQGEIIVADNCLHSINSFGVHHLGKWKCYSGNSYSLDGLEYTIDYVRTENPKLTPVIEETQTELTIGCKVDRYYLGAFTYCKLTAPNQKTFNVKSGSATERYTALGTRPTKGICLVNIKKPLLPFENGYWRCQIVGPYKNDFGGVFLKIGEANRPEYKTRQTLKIELFKPFGIYCEVPYESDYCYVKSPNGTIYKNLFHQQVNIGKCTMSATSALPSDNGTWICYFARDTGVPSEEIVVEVIVSDILHSYESVEVDAGSTAQLLCTSDGLPLSYCEFIAPNGSVYFIKKQESTNNIRYYGKGLEYGDCGISITKTAVENNGVWTCVVRFVRDEKQEEMLAKISLIVEPNVNVAGLGIGLSVGVVLVGAIVGFFIFRKWKRRHHAEIPELQVRADLDNISDNSDVILQTQ